jgi:hypothetical protein
MNYNKLIQGILAGTIATSTLLPNIVDAKPKKEQEPQKVERLTDRIGKNLERLNRAYCVNHPIKCSKNGIRKFRKNHNF